MGAPAAGPAVAPPLKPRDKSPALARAAAAEEEATQSAKAPESEGSLLLLVVATITDVGETNLQAFYNGEGAFEGTIYGGIYRFVGSLKLYQKRDLVRERKREKGSVLC